jgi:hypothetical protein
MTVGKLQSLSYRPVPLKARGPWDRMAGTLAPALAAACAFGLATFGLAKSYAFVDGNRYIAFMR